MNEDPASVLDTADNPEAITNVVRAGCWSEFLIQRLKAKILRGPCTSSVAVPKRQSNRGIDLFEESVRGKDNSQDSDTQTH